MVGAEAVAWRGQGLLSSLASVGKNWCLRAGARAFTLRPAGDTLIM